jgi:hypothetical protein
VSPSEGKIGPEKRRCAKTLLVVPVRVRSDARGDRARDVERGKGSSLELECYIELSHSFSSFRSSRHC